MIPPPGENRQLHADLTAEKQITGLTMAFHTEKSIADLIAIASSDDVSVSGPAARELLRRKEECVPHADEIVDLLRHGNAAIADLAYRTLQRIGRPAVAALLDALPSASDRHRAYLLSLLVASAEFETWYPIVHAELNSSDEPCRYHAANCLGRAYDATNPWPEYMLNSLDQSIALLRDCRRNPDKLVYWPQARMTLKQLGLLDQNAK